MRPPRASRVLAAALTATVLLSLAVVSAAPSGAQRWLFGGYDLQNTRYNAVEDTIGVTTVGALVARWKLDTVADVSATPAVDGDTVYVPDFSGEIYAVNRKTGALRWKTNVAALTAIPGDHARATPAIAGDVLIVGDQAGKVGSYVGYLLALDKHTGALLWKTMVPGGGFPIITQAAVVVGNTAYVGIASFEEALVRFGVPLSFRGSVLAVDVATGVVRWQTFMAPQPASPTAPSSERYTGNAVWGSTPAVDLARNQLYVATGNNYGVPDEAVTCIGLATSPEARAACLASDNLFDAIVALDLTTGVVKWSFKALPDDVWNLACGIYFIVGLEDPVEGCPASASRGPDYDFGQGPALFTTRGTKGVKRELVGAGQKSGVYWTVDPSTGALVWKTQAGTGGLAGGLQWGSAVDGKRVYVANSNSEFKPWTLTNGQTVYRGGWSALDAATGAILWQTTNPLPERAMGPVSGANGVVYGCSMDDVGHMYAMNAATGAILWDFESGANCLGGAAISGGMVFWGTGYDAFKATPGPANDVQGLYAFGLPE